MSPIKGTMAKGDSDEAGFSAREALINSNKDMAENLMITDLVRHELATLCEDGQVRVETLNQILETPYAFHLVSHISGQLKKESSISAIIRTLVPGGSITGAPKKSVLNAIRPLEVSPRGFYTGHLGVIKGGEISMSILIRTLESNPQEEGYRYGSGGGITLASDQALEWRELRLKLRALDPFL